MGVDSYYSGDLVTLYHGRALDVLRALPVEPCTVLDPFGGTGTVAEVAIRLKRQAVLIEIGEAYCKQAIDRFGRPIQISML